MEIPKLTVTQYNRLVNEILDPVEVIVEGEISEWNVWQGRYIYASIKDADASAGIFATVFEIHNASSIAVGMKVSVRGRPSVHTKTGKMSLNAKEITPIGDGNIAQAFDLLKKKLESEGLFDKSRKRAIPLFPTNIGLITAKDSQAYNDFTKILGQRWTGCNIYFLPAQVQGKESVNSIVEALKYFNDNFDSSKIDVLIVARGGGSSEDLISFNDERIVRAVYASKIPVVSGVGHEGDITLIDYVSDLRASTPSNAAELISPDRTELIKKLDHYQTLLSSDIRMLTENGEKDLAEVSIKLNGCLEKIVDIYDEKIKTSERLLNSYSYKNILKRGFSIAKNKSGKVVKSAEEAKNSLNLTIEFDDGEVETKVVKGKSEDSNLVMF